MAPIIEEKMEELEENLETDISVDDIPDIEIPVSPKLNQFERCRMHSESLHKDQKYGEEPYFEAHVDVIAERIFEVYGNEHPHILPLILVALYHDAVEDGHITLEELKEYVTPDIIHSVDCITKRKGEQLEDYVIRLSHDEIAYQVKYFDVMENLSNSVRDNNARRISKYTNTLSFLHEYTFNRLDKCFLTDTMEDTEYQARIDMEGPDLSIMKYFNIVIGYSYEMNGESMFFYLLRHIQTGDLRLVESDYNNGNTDFSLNHMKTIDIDTFKSTMTERFNKHVPRYTDSLVSHIEDLDKVNYFIR